MADGLGSVQKLLPRTALFFWRPASLLAPYRSLEYARPSESAKKSLVVLVN
jgi:hypothetical protein